MPLFAFEVVDSRGQSQIKSSKSPCFAPLPQWRNRGWHSFSGGPKPKGKDTPYELYIKAESYEDAKVWADAIISRFGGDYQFTLEVIEKCVHLGNSPAWLISWPADTQWDLAYAVTKLFFKNITYNPIAPMYSEKRMVQVLKDGGSVLEAMVFHQVYCRIGYVYPLQSKINKDQAIAFIEQGPAFVTDGWYEDKLNGPGRIDYMNNHKPTAGLKHGSSIWEMPYHGSETATLEHLRALLKKE